MSAPLVRYACADGIGRITLDRPPVNVLTTGMLEELEAALGTAASDRQVKVVVLAGSGRAFCAGVDVADHTDGRIGPSLQRFHAVVRRMMTLEAPLVAQLHGAALGGGCELALACDIVLAADTLKLGQPEITLGVFPPVAAALLPRLVGRQRALDMILSGVTLDVADARAMGLVSRAWPADCFQVEADAYVARLASLSRPALRLAKRAVTGALETGWDEALARAEALYLDELMQYPDAHEGVAAFMEKRPPVWQEA